MALRQGLAASVAVARLQGQSIRASGRIERCHSKGRRTHRCGLRRCGEGGPRRGLRVRLRVRLGCAVHKPGSVSESNTGAGSQNRTPSGRSRLSVYIIATSDAADVWMCRPLPFANVLIILSLTLFRLQRACSAQQQQGPCRSAAPRIRCEQITNNRAGSHIHPG